MNYFVKKKDEETYQINNDRVVDQLNKETLEIGKKITVFGTVPHYLTVDDIKEDAIIFTDDLHS